MMVGYRGCSSLLTNSYILIIFKYENAFLLLDEAFCEALTDSSHAYNYRAHTYWTTTRKMV